MLFEDVVRVGSRPGLRAPADAVFAYLAVRDRGRALDFDPHRTGSSIVSRMMLSSGCT